MSRIDLSRDQLPLIFEVKDAVSILSCKYEAPSKLLESLVKSGQLYRLKRGTYAFVDGFDPLIAANALYGPSYVSFEAALSYYGLIPERVEIIRSVVDGRPAQFHAEVGDFLYHAQHRDLFAAGMSYQTVQGQPLLIASPEKALLDTLAWAKLKAKTLKPQDVMDFVLEGFRFDEESLSRLSIRKLGRMASAYHNKAPLKFVAALKGRKSNE